MMQNPAKIAYMQWVTEEEETRQKNIVLARDYYAGDHHITLTDRQREYLGFDADQKFAINYAKMVIDVIAERLRIANFAGDDALAAFAIEEWNRAKLRAMSKRLFKWVLRDGAAFVIVDKDENDQLRYTLHPAYTSEMIDGDGYGCKAHFKNENIYSDLEYVTKRWTEIYYDDKGRRHTRKRMTLYYPDRVEKYAMAGTGDTGDATWQPYMDEGDTAPVIPWEYGFPAAVPFLNDEGLSQLGTEIITTQDALNKTWLDILASADRAGFGIYISRGFWPTTDGKQLASDNSNALDIGPGVWIGTTDPTSSVDMIQAAELKQLLDVKDHLLFDLARITGIPMSRLQASGQIAAEGTLKQQESALISVVEDRQDIFGDSWEKVFGLAARIAGVSDNGVIEAQWKPAAPRDETEQVTRAAVMVKDLDVPAPFAWRRAGFTEEEVQEMLKSPEYQAKLAGQRALLDLNDLEEG